MRAARDVLLFAAGLAAPVLAAAALGDGSSDAALEDAEAGDWTNSTESAERCKSSEYPLDSRCTGCPPMYNGKLCASTTWYEDRTLGSCGCGTPGVPFVDDDYWTLTGWTAALNAVNLDPVHPEAGWCPSGCGQCYELCSTGGMTNTMEMVAEAGICKVFKITNRCADGWVEDQANWCSQKLTWQECAASPEKCQEDRSTNMFGYTAHFDLQDAHRQIQNVLGWNNAEVTFEPVSCDRWEGPADSVCEACAV